MRFRLLSCLKPVVQWREVVMSRCHGNKFLDLNKPWFGKYDRKKRRKLSYMTFLSMISLKK